MSAFSRRTILRATAASAALAATPETVDPVVVLFAQWQTACQALYDFKEAAEGAGWDFSDADIEPLWERHDQLVDALLFAQATSWQGVLAKIRIASWSSENSPYERPGVTGDMDQRFVFSAHADAERLAGRAQA
jgi:hypothetical protein